VAEAQVKLKPGDVLVLYTDGIIEARSMAGEFYGVERLHAVASALHRRLGPGECSRPCCPTSTSFVADAPQADDQTVVCFSIGELPVAGQRFSSGPPPPESRL
jgi:sigma-B regulation protein RsbU (phosphoserine phosphatase)